MLAAAAVVCITMTFAQVGPNAPFSSSPSSTPSSSSPSGGQAPSAFGGGGINPNDIDPPPDPVDTPIDAGVIFLLIIGTAYGVRKMAPGDKELIKG